VPQTKIRIYAEQFLLLLRRQTAKRCCGQLGASHIGRLKLISPNDDFAVGDAAISTVRMKRVVGANTEL
jgi:hypothetical protein